MQKYGMTGIEIVEKPVSIALKHKLDHDLYDIENNCLYLNLLQLALLYVCLSFNSVASKDDLKMAVCLTQKYRMIFHVPDGLLLSIYDCFIFALKENLKVNENE